MLNKDPECGAEFEEVLGIVPVKGELVLTSIRVSDIVIWLCTRHLMELR